MRHNPRGVVALHPEPSLLRCGRRDIHHHLTFRVEISNLLTCTRERNSPPLLSEGGDNPCRTKEPTTTFLGGWRPYMHSGGGRIARPLSRGSSLTPCIKNRGGRGEGLHGERTRSPTRYMLGFRPAPTGMVTSITVPAAKAPRVTCPALQGGHRGHPVRKQIRTTSTRDCAVCPVRYHQFTHLGVWSSGCLRKGATGGPFTCPLIFQFLIKILTTKVKI